MARESHRQLTVALLAMCTALLSAADAPEGRRLREIVVDRYPQGKVYIGGTTGWQKRAKGSGVTLDREFSYVTPENDFKHSTINPKPGVWKWELADNWVTHCAKSKQVLRIHGPISPQCSRWAKEDDRSAEELEKSLVDFMSKLCQRYDKFLHVKWLDVVNETVNRGKWHGPRPGTVRWENPWTKIGFDQSHPLKPPKYINLAFQVANKYAPNTKLIINQHGFDAKSWEMIKGLVSYLRDAGLRVDGIGWQAHVDVGFEKDPENIRRLGELIRWAHKNKLSFHVTENNVWLHGKKKDYQAQARTFAAILHVLLENRQSGVVTWNVWNLSDGDSWSEKKAFDGCLFDRDYSPKPAYYALQQLLEKPPKAK